MTRRSSGVPLALTRVQKIVLETLAYAASLPIDDVDRDANIFDLGLDSLDFWTILMDIEERAGTEVPSEVLDALAQLDGQITVAHIIDATAVWTPGDVVGR